MGRVEIIDCDTDPLEARREFRRRMLRYGVSTASIVLVAAGLIASTLYTNAINRADVLALSRTLIDALNSRVLTEVRAYQAPARNTVDSLSAALPANPWSNSGRSIFERVARESLRHHAQIAALYLGAANGDFLMVTRNEAGTADTKLITRTPQGSKTTWTRRDKNDRVTAIEPDEADRYDPRTRPWYRDAMTADGVTWSQVYIFFTSRSPGITVSKARRPGDGAADVVIGADIRLDQLSTFLENLQKQARGTLTIVDSDGRIVAFDEPDRVMIESEAGPRPRTIRELDRPALVEAFDRLRIAGPGRSIVEIDGERYIFGASSLRTEVSHNRLSREWWLMLLAPESAYLGFVAVNGRRGLIASSGVIILAIVLAGFLTYQGVAADRHARAVRAGEERLEAQRQIFDELAGFSDLPDIDDEHDLRQASEILARAEGAKRVSFWRIRQDGKSLECLDAFEAETRGHTGGALINAADFEEIFSQISEGREIELRDARIDPRATGLQLTYLQAVGTTSLTSIPVMFAKQVLGAIWIEDADPVNAVAADRSLAGTVANLLAPRLRMMADADRNETPGADIASGAPRNATAASSALLEGALQDRAVRTASLVESRRKIIGPDGDPKFVSVSVFPGTTVLSLKLLDDEALAASSSDGHNDAVIRDIVSTFEQATDANGIRYVKILTDQVLAVEGFSAEMHEDDMREAAARLVDVALRLRERCNAIFLASGQGPQFTMGVDSGATFGSSVGFGNSPYNIWGEAVRIANALAETAEPGTIQVSESTYDLLRDACVFRRRGAFFMGRFGEMTTFTLRGRL